MKRRVAIEALMIGTMIARAIQLADELHRLYKFHKPKHALGFAQSQPSRRAELTARLRRR